MDCTAWAQLSQIINSPGHRSGEQRDAPPRGMLVQLRLSAEAGLPTPLSCTQLVHHLPLPSGYAVRSEAEGSELPLTQGHAVSPQPAPQQLLLSL